VIWYGSEGWLLPVDYICKKMMMRMRRRRMMMMMDSFLGFGVLGWEC